ncbi:MAG TPA: acetate/propionate family kinase [Candidatus Acidoferrum sp.]|nr:acetate/propionate family kinase [Candidatus Acidoferrum sp.]
MSATVILSLNSGSSSLKFGLFEVSEEDPRRIYAGAVEGIGAANGHFWVRSADGRTLQENRSPVPDQDSALRTVARLILDGSLPSPQAIGHRVVHGGPNLREHQRITPQVIAELERISVLAPLHVPVQLRLIRLTESHFPAVPQFACFDTAFHRTLTEEAARFPLPDSFWSAGVRRYGFHGLSCESILHDLGSSAPPRLIIAHLGSGASVTAVFDGKSVDNTMGLTPTGGIVMGTRPGDLDPGVFLYMLRAAQIQPESLEALLDRQSGLLGISGFSNDMKQLRASSDPRAKLAIDIFCRSVKKSIGAFVAILGGLDTLVFAGGVGENDPASRRQICQGLEAFGIALDEPKNANSLSIISSDDSRATLRIQHSDEEIQIARQTARLLA